MWKLLEDVSLATLMARLGVAFALVVSLTLSGLGYVALRNALQEAAVDELAFDSDLRAKDLAATFHEMRLNAGFLASTPAVTEAIALLRPEPNGPHPAPAETRQARQTLEKTLASFLAQHPEFTQARLLGLPPRAPELVRVNSKRGRIEIVPPGELQDKGAEPYMQVAAWMSPGDWYLSEVTLNREHGRVDPERLPTIRGVFAVPGDLGRVAAYIVLNADYVAFLQHAIGAVGAGVELHVGTENGHTTILSAKTTMPQMIFRGEEAEEVSHLLSLPAHAQHGGDARADVIHMAQDVYIGGGRTLSLDTHIEQALLLADARRKLLDIGTVAAALTLVMALAGLVAGRWVMRPITRLTRAVGRPRPTLEPLKLDVTGYKEVRQLAAAFEKVSGDLAREGRNAEAVFSAAAEGILLTDETGSILRANPAAGTIFGADVATLPGAHVESLMPERFRATHHLNVASLERRGGSQRLGHERDVFGLRANGEEFPLEASINQVKIEGHKTVIAVVRDISERRARETQLAEQARELEWRATHDQLSGLLNRRGVDEAIRTLAEGVGRATLIQLDLDRFKHVNDTLGHEAGDAVIAAVGERLKALAHPDDAIGRMGGDEFIIIRQGADEDATANFAEQAIPALAAPVDFKGRLCRFGVSMGAATGSVADLLTGEMFKRADHALYRAKGEGRGRFRMFSHEMERRLKDRANLAADLEEAIEKNSLSLAYMPKVAAEDGRLIGLEALVRWAHPSRGSVSPAVFLPIADELKLTEVLDSQVLAHVLRDREQWLAAGYAVPTVSVNVSARRLLEPNLVQKVRDMNLPRGAINFELLESIFLDDTSEMVTWNIDGLRDMGIGIEIDDFGSGHASILGIMKVRPDWIKIDQAIVRQLSLSDSGESLVKAIIDMAVPFDISVVAEGVETAHQAELLRRLGCTALQGYYIGKGGSSAQTAQRLATTSTRAARPA